MCNSNWRYDYNFGKPEAASTQPKIGEALNVQVFDKIFHALYCTVDRKQFGPGKFASAIMMSDLIGSIFECCLERLHM